MLNLPTNENNVLKNLKCFRGFLTDSTEQGQFCCLQQQQQLQRNFLSLLNSLGAFSIAPEERKYTALITLSILTCPCSANVQRLVTSWNESGVRWSVPIPIAHPRPLCLPAYHLYLPPQPSLLLIRARYQVLWLGSNYLPGPNRPRPSPIFKQASAPHLVLLFFPLAIVLRNKSLWVFLLTSFCAWLYDLWCMAALYSQGGGYFNIK